MQFWCYMNFRGCINFKYYRTSCGFCGFQNEGTLFAVYSINGFVFRTEIENVQYAVRNEFLLIVIWLNCEAIFRRPVTVEGKIQCRSRLCRICSGKMTLQESFWEKITFSSVSSYHYSRPHIHVYLHADMRQSQTGEAWRTSKGNDLSNIRNAG